MSKWRDTLELWLSTIEVSGDVLDIGGAQKPVASRLLKSSKIDNYVIADTQGKYDIFMDIDNETHYNLVPFDNVFMLETLMYAKDPVRALKNACLFPKKDLYISNPLEAYGETKPEGTDMHRMFPNWWVYWLEKMDMNIQEMKVIEPTNGLMNFNEGRAKEGYKMIRPHRSGILIHAKRI